MFSARENTSGSSFSLVVIRRMLDVLGDSGEIKKTNLAGKTGLNYPNCMRYLELLKMLGWVKTADDGSNHISLSEQGTHFRSVISSMKNNSRDNDIIGSFLSSADEPEFQHRGAEEIQQAQYCGRSTCNIMLVDDEPDVLLIYKVFLTKQGYNVETFSDAKSALENITSIGPSYYDLVVTDIRMESMNGLQLYHKIKSVDPNLKVMFVSALDAVKELVSVLPGITSKDVIKKPVSQQEFVRAIRNALSKAPSGKSVSPSIGK